MTAYQNKWRRGDGAEACSSASIAAKRLRTNDGSTPRTRLRRRPDILRRREADNARAEAHDARAIAPSDAQTIARHRAAPDPERRALAPLG
jgi:hypothetical protein